MFKPVNGAVGCIQAGINNVSNVLSIDGDTYAKLSNALTVDDHTYMQLGEGTLVEIVRVQQLLGASLVSVARGQDDSVPRAFPFNTKLQYVFCAAAVQDMINGVSPPTILIEAAAGSSIVVTELAVGQYEIGMEPVSIASSNGSVIITGEFPSLDLTLDPSKTGCGCT